MKTKILIVQTLFLSNLLFASSQAFPFEMHSVNARMGLGLTALSVFIKSDRLQKRSENTSSLFLDMRAKEFEKVNLSVGGERTGSEYRIYPTNNASEYEKYDYESSFLVFKLGYIFTFHAIQVLPSLNLGLGEFKISGKDASETSSSQIIGWNVEVRSSFLEDFYYLFGIGYYWLIYPELSNDTFKDQADLKAKGNLQAGIGYNF